MKTKERVYISGAITGTKFYRVRFSLAELKLRLMGKEVVNPAKLYHILGPSFSHAEHMSICIPLLELCNSIYMLRSWYFSKGASIELFKAMDTEKTIYFSRSAFKEWFYSHRTNKLQ